MSERETSCDRGASLPPVEHETPRLVAIDDSKLIHRLLRARLKHEQIEIHCASSGQEGVEMVREINPEVILLDIDMPGMNGFEVLKVLKSDDDLKDIPVIFVSGTCEISRIIEGLDAGAHDFVPKPFEPAELRARVRAAVRLGSMIKMLAQRAQLDGMTGLWNRSYFNTRIESEFNESIRHNTDVSVIFCDLDHFKSLNDNHGHPFGDAVLRRFANIINSDRSYDVACRYGGEEFVLIIPQADAGIAAGLAERIRQELFDTVWSEHPDIKVTASFGVASMRETGVTSAAQLVKVADDALYAAKNSGRNQVVRATGGEGHLRVSA